MYRDAAGAGVRLTWISMNTPLQTAEQLCSTLSADSGGLASLRHHCSRVMQRTMLGWLCIIFEFVCDDCRCSHR
jgi:hypothetical protein